MSSKTAKIFHGIVLACAVICAIVGFLYVATAVATKLINDALTIFGSENDNDSSLFDEEEKKVEPVIVEAPDDTASEDFECV